MLLPHIHTNLKEAHNEKFYLIKPINRHNLRIKAIKTISHHTKIKNIKKNLSSTALLLIRIFSF